MGSNGPAWGRRHLEQTAARDHYKRLRQQADAAAIKYWNIRLEQGEPLRPSPMLGQAIDAGYRFLRVRCTGCKQTAFVAIEDIRRPRSTRLWTLEDAMACQRCGSGPFRPRARLERVTRDRDIGWANP